MPKPKMGELNCGSCEKKVTFKRPCITPECDNFLCADCLGNDLIYCSKCITEDLILELEMSLLRIQMHELTKLIIDHNCYFPELDVLSESSEEDMSSESSEEDMSSEEEECDCVEVMSDESN